MKLSKAQERALEAVKVGAVKHAHPFAWGVEEPYYDVKGITLQKLVEKRLIRVIANAPSYWRPVIAIEKGKQ